MEIRIQMRTREGNAFAEALYTGEQTIVLPGGRISNNFAEHIRGGTFG